jgi:hypothetical protein
MCATTRPCRVHMLFLALVVLLSSCAIYEEPMTGPYAFISAAAPGFDLSLGYAGYCGSKALLPIREKQTIRIQAGERAWIAALAGGRYSGGCTGVITFVPEATAHYLIKFAGCKYMMVRAHADGRLSEVHSLKTEENRSCLGSS